MQTSLLELVRAEDSAEHLAIYFGVTSGGYTGRKFNTLGGGGDRQQTRHVITADDLVAVQTLSVTVPAAAAIELLEGEPGRKISALLARIPTDVELGIEGAEELVGCAAGCTGHTADCSPAHQAWLLLCEQDGICWVTAGKLLARKRPNLVPVYDGIVACQFGNPKRVWLKLHHELAKDHGVLRDDLTRLRARAGIPDAISLLRVLDVVLWMKHHKRHQSSRTCPEHGTVALAEESDGHD